MDNGRFLAFSLGPMRGIYFIGWIGWAWTLGLSALRADDVRSALRDAALGILAEGSPGVAIAVVKDGQAYYCNAGSSGRPGLRVTNRTLFETASITKVLTTTLLGMDVARGDKSLDDRAGSYLRGYPLQPRFRAATLQMLATYTAGLPDVPTDYAKLPGRLRGLSGYSVEHFLRYVNHFQPAGRLPAARVYSDTSIGLLGLCLSNLRLGTWKRRLQTEIFDPLGMIDTTLQPNADQASRLARGADAGQFIARRPVDAMAAADGIKSTTHDLAFFLLAALGDVRNPPPSFNAGLSIATETGALFMSGGAVQFQGLGWQSQPMTIGNRKFWVVTKSGNVPGFSSKISFCRSLDVGVVILTNDSQVDLGGLELNLVKRVAKLP